MGHYAVVVAAGSGTRMGTDIAKQYLILLGKPVLAHTLTRISSFDFIDGIIVVTREKEIDFCRTEIINRFGLDKVKDIVCGGKRRQDSVFNGLKRLKEIKPDIVFVHDGVRPFFSSSLFKDIYEKTKEYGAAISAVPVVCTIKESDDLMFVNKTVSRDKLWEIQTPQGFSFELIYDAYKNVYNTDESIILTDEAMAIEYAGKKVKIVEGNRENIKITTPVDLIIAGQILERKKI